MFFTTAWPVGLQLVRKPRRPVCGDAFSTMPRCSLMGKPYVVGLRNLNQDVENRITPLFKYSSTENKSGRKYTKVLTLVDSAHSNQRGLVKSPALVPRAHSEQGPSLQTGLPMEGLWVLPLRAALRRRSRNHQLRPGRGRPVSLEETHSVWHCLSAPVGECPSLLFLEKSDCFKSMSWLP